MKKYQLNFINCDAASDEISSNSEIAIQQNNIANELKIANNLKELELKLKFIELLHFGIKDNVEETRLDLKNLHFYQKLTGCFMDE